MHPRVAELIKHFALAPHPEGGHYRELFRSTTPVTPSDGRGPRSILTGIYFLLARGEHSAWHRVTSDEVWHVYEGEGIELLLAAPDCTTIVRHRLTTLSDGTGEPQRLVPAGWWQAARPLGSYALAGCNVAPGFDFADFSFLRDHSTHVDALTRSAPDLLTLL
jgi:uncharacterized protein